MARTRVSERSFAYDVFVAHATEDNQTFVIPLVKRLRSSGLGVWYSGIDSAFWPAGCDSDSALAGFLTERMNRCRAGVLVLSNAFLSKKWPMHELVHWSSVDPDRHSIFAILHGVGIEEVAIAASRGQTTSEKWKVIASWEGAERVVDLVLSKFEPRAVVHQMDIEAPGEVVIFPERGDFFVGQSGGMFKGGKVRFFDFAGNEIANKFFGAFKTFTSAEDLVVGNKKSKHEGKVFDVEKDLRFMYVNHIKMQPVSDEEVKCGVYLNLGTNKMPMVLAPFFTCPALTAGAAIDELPDVLVEGLKVAAGQFRGNWRKFLISANGKGFNIESQS